MFERRRDEKGMKDMDFYRDEIIIIIEKEKLNAMGMASKVTQKY